MLQTGERSALLKLLSRLDESESAESDADEADQNRNWTAIVERLNSGVVSETRIQMGSAGSAQVTGVRLRKQWDNLNVRTEGDTLILSLGE